MKFETRMSLKLFDMLESELYIIHSICSDKYTMNHESNAIDNNSNMFCFVLHAHSVRNGNPPNGNGAPAGRRVGLDADNRR